MKEERKKEKRERFGKMEKNVKKIILFKIYKRIIEVGEERRLMNITKDMENEEMGGIQKGIKEG